MKIYREEAQPEPLLISAKHAARLLSISERYLYTLTQRGELACIRMGRSVRYRTGDIQRFIDARIGSIAEPSA